MFSRLRQTSQRLGQAALRFRARRSRRFATTARTITVADPATQQALTMTSSWVKMWRYDNSRQILTLFTKDGKRYDYNDIPADVGSAVINAWVACKTTDTSDKVEWWKGKRPSWGAAYHHILKPFLERGARP